MSELDGASILVACTLRSGSNYLCAAIKSLGLSAPTEYFQELAYANNKSSLSLDASKLPSALEIYQRARLSQVDFPAFGVKWNWSQFETIRSELSKFRDFNELFPRPIWIKLSRRRRAEQAVSLYVAKKSDVWVAGDAPRLSASIDYNFVDVLSCLDEIIREDILWEKFFRESEINPIRIDYEDFILDPPRALCSALGLSQTEVAFDKATYQPTTTIANRLVLESFETDLARSPSVPRPEVSADILERVAQLADATLIANVSGRLLDHTPGIYPQIRKIDLRNHSGFLGAVEAIEEPHFRDFVGFRMGPNSAFDLTVQARSVLIELLSHPWSGFVEVAFDDEMRKIDLFHYATTYRPLFKTWENSEPRRLRITPLQRKNDLSEGFEVWLQRLWIVD